MKKMTCLSIVVMLFLLTVTLPLQSVRAEKNIISNNTGYINYSPNKSILTKYNDLVNESQENRKNSKLLIPENELIYGDFSILNLISAENTEIVYHDKDDTTTSVIQHDTNYDIYSLVISTEYSNFVTYIVDGKSFEVVLEGENINLYSDNGQVLPLLITEYDYFNSYVEKMTNSPYHANVDGIDGKHDKASFGAERGPFYKTNKVLVEVLTTLAAATALIKHPVFSTISVVTGTISFIGNVAYATLYIKFWQSNSLSDLTYVKERGTVYNYNSYTSPVKSYTHYFYSSQPY